MDLKLKSDISNDLIQNADQIGSVGKAIAEFAWNSLQYQPEGQVARVAIFVIRNHAGAVDEISIEDNGRGMDQQDTARFFTMHHENLDRAQGKAGRGRFGTGAKAAAMAIADRMVVETVKDGKLITACLDRKSLKPGLSEVAIPAEVAHTKRGNGTRIQLTHFRSKKRFNERAAREYVLRSLGRHLHVAEVTWNNERLCYAEPPFRAEWTFTPPEELAHVFGDVQLRVRLAESWLSEDERGVSITVMDVPQERGFLGRHAGSPYAARLYGMVEVPLLDKNDEEDRPAYTADRTLRLNRENLRVEELLGWIESVIGQLMRQLDVEERAAQDRARQERLSQTAKTIEEALNRRLQRAFENLERKLKLQTGQANVSGLDVTEGQSYETEEVRAGVDEEVLVRDDSADSRYRDVTEGEKGDIQVREHREHEKHSGGACEPGEPDAENNGKRDPPAEKGAKASETSKGEQRHLRPKGSFRVIPKAMGVDGPRAYYAATMMTIFVNTDHPQLAAAGDPEKGEFKVLMAECAAGEFALAVTSIRIEHGDPDIDPGQWHTILTSVRREQSETGAELAQAIVSYRQPVAC